MRFTLGIGVAREHQINGIHLLPPFLETDVQPDRELSDRDPAGQRNVLVDGGDGDLARLDAGRFGFRCPSFR